MFIALVAVVLVWNAALLWALYRRMSRSVAKAEEMEGPMTSVIGSLRGTITRVEAVSARATEVSATARQRVGGFGGDLDRAQNRFRYGLAKLDFEMDRISGGVQDGTDKVKSAVSEPLSRAGAIVQGIRAILELVTISRGNDLTRR